MRTATLPPTTTGAPVPLFRHRVAATAAGPSAKAPASYHALRLFLLLLYANVAMWIPALEVVRPAQLSVIAAVGFLMYEVAGGRRRLQLTWPEGYFMAAFLGAAALSCFTALWPGFAVETTIELAKCLVVYVLLSLTVDSVPRLKGVFWTVVVGGLFPALGTVHFYQAGYTSEGRAGWLGIFGNPNDAAYSLVILLPIAYAVGTLSGWKGRLLAAFALLAYSAGIYTTFSRGGLLGFFAVLVLTVLRVRSNAMRAAAVLLMLLAFVAMGFFWHRADSGSSGLGASETIDQRVITVKAGLDMFSDYPLLGVGPGCSVIGFEIYAPSSYLTHKSLIVHNTLVQALAETGLGGVIPYLLLIGSALLGAHKLARRRPGATAEEAQASVMAAALEASIVGFLVCGLSGGYVMSWFPYILCGLVSAARRIVPAGHEKRLSEAA
jgi:O-antigen ligase